MDELVESIAAKIKELNGNQTVSAAFVVGGGGKIHGFIEHLCEELELPQERVALRGEEVLQEIHFVQEDIKKDPLLVTPIGICLNYYDQRNNFIFVRRLNHNVAVNFQRRIDIGQAPVHPDHCRITRFSPGNAFFAVDREINFLPPSRK